MNKRGISPLIATVLIIGFTIVLAALVITWGNKLFKDTVESTGKSSELNLLCTNIDYSATATVTKKDPISPWLINSNPYHSVGFNVENKNKEPISGFYALVKDSSGGSFSFTTDSNVVKANCKIFDSTGTTEANQKFTLEPFGTKKYTTWNKVIIPDVATTLSETPFDGGFGLCDMFPTTSTLTASRTFLNNLNNLDNLNPRPYIVADLRPIVTLGNGESMVCDKQVQTVDLVYS